MKRDALEGINPIIYVIISVRFKFYFCSLLSVEKNLFFFLISDYFDFLMLENSARGNDEGTNPLTYFMEILFLQDFLLIPIHKKIRDEFPSLQDQYKISVRKIWKTWTKINRVFCSASLFTPPQNTPPHPKNTITCPILLQNTDLCAHLIYLIILLKKKNPDELRLRKKILRRIIYLLFPVRSSLETIRFNDSLVRFHLLGVVLFFFFFHFLKKEKTHICKMLKKQL